MADANGGPAPAQRGRTPGLTAPMAAARRKCALQPPEVGQAECANVTKFHALGLSTAVATLPASHSPVLGEPAQLGQSSSQEGTRTTVTRSVKSSSVVSGSVSSTGLFSSAASQLLNVHAYCFAQV